MSKNLTPFAQEMKQQQDIVEGMPKLRMSDVELQVIGQLKPFEQSQAIASLLLQKHPATLDQSLPFGKENDLLGLMGKGKPRYLDYRSIFQIAIAVSAARFLATDKDCTKADFTQPLSTISLAQLFEKLDPAIYMTAAENAADICVALMKADAQLSPYNVEKSTDGNTTTMTHKVTGDVHTLHEDSAGQITGATCFAAGCTGHESTQS